MQCYKGRGAMHERQLKFIFHTIGTVGFGMIAAAAFFSGWHVMAAVFAIIAIALLVHGIRLTKRQSAGADAG